MGTNYYLKSKPCETCGHCQNEIHIGKSCVGWQFLFKSHYPSLGSYSEWIDEINNEKKQIYNEYNEKIEKDDFFKMIENKKTGREGGEDYCDLGYRFTNKDFS